jgi:hypothetical protein
VRAVMNRPVSRRDMSLSSPCSGGRNVLQSGPGQRIPARDTHESLSPDALLAVPSKNKARIRSLGGTREGDRLS